MRAKKMRVYEDFDEDDEEPLFQCGDGITMECVCPKCGDHPPHENPVGRPGQTQKVLPGLQNVYHHPGNGGVAVHPGVGEPGGGMNCPPKFPKLMASKKSRLRRIAHSDVAWKMFFCGSGFPATMEPSISVASKSRLESRSHNKACRLLGNRKKIMVRSCGGRQSW